MNKTLCFIFLFFIPNMSLFAQRVFDFGGDIDKFDISSRNLRYSRALPAASPMKEYGELFWKDELVLHKDTISDDYYCPFCISADSLRPMGIEDWELLMKNRTLIISEDSLKVVALDMHKGSLMFYVEYQNRTYSDDIKRVLPNGFEYNYIRATPCAYSYLKVSADKYIILISDHPQYRRSFGYYILPLKDRLKVKTDWLDMTVDYDMPNYLLYDDDSLYYRNLYVGSYYSIKQSDDGRQQLYDDFGFPYPVIADSIQLTYEYIITNDFEKQRCKIYDKLLNVQPYRNIRSVTSNLQVLAGRKVKWLENGKLLNRPTRGMTAWPDGPSWYYFDMEKAGDNFIFHQSGSTHYGIKLEKQSFTLTNPENIDSIFFDNREVILRTYHYPHSGTIPRDVDILYIKTKEGKYNICTFTIDSDSVTFTIIPMLATDVEHVEMRHPRYFYNKGRVGYYPEMRTVDYKEIKELSGNFLRVRTLQGKKAWYNMQNKRLYYD